MAIHVIRGAAATVSFTTPQEIVINKTDDSIAAWGTDGSTQRQLKTDATGELQVDVLTMPSVTVSGTVQPGNTPNSVPWLVDMRRGNTILFAAIDVASSGDNTIIAADGTKKIKVLSYTLVVDAAVTARWKSGSTALSGAMSFSANGGVSSPSGSAGGGWLMETAANQALVLNLGGAVGARGHVSYFLEV